MHAESGSQDTGDTELPAGLCVLVLCALVHGCCGAVGVVHWPDDTPASDQYSEDIGEGDRRPAGPLYAIVENVGKDTAEDIPDKGVQQAAADIAEALGCTGKGMHRHG